MKLLKLSDVQIRYRRSNELVCRSSSLVPLLAIALSLTGVLAFLVMFIQRHRWPPVIPSIIMAIFGVIFIGSCLKKFRQTIKPYNWLIRYSDGRLLIKFRSYLNHMLPAEDLQIISIDRSEISSINRTWINRITGTDKSHKYEQTLSFIDIHLNTTDTDHIDQALEKERKTVYDSDLNTTMDFPVRLVDGKIIRVSWKKTTTPLMESVLKFLSNHVSVTETVELTQNLLIENENRGQIEDQVDELLEADKKSDAIELVQKSFSLSREDAKCFIEFC